MATQDSTAKREGRVRLPSISIRHLPAMLQTGALSLLATMGVVGILVLLSIPIDFWKGKHIFDTFQDVIQDLFPDMTPLEVLTQFFAPAAVGATVAGTTAVAATTVVAEKAAAARAEEPEGERERLLAAVASLSEQVRRLEARAAAAVAPSPVLVDGAIFIYEQVLKLRMHLENFKRATPTRETLLAALGSARIVAPPPYTHAASSDPRVSAVVELVNVMNNTVIRETSVLPHNTDFNVVQSTIRHMAVLLEDVFNRLEDKLFGIVRAESQSPQAWERIQALKDTFYWESPK